MRTMENLSHCSLMMLNLLWIFIAIRTNRTWFYESKNICVWRSVGTPWHKHPGPQLCCCLFYNHLYVFDTILYSHTPLLRTLFFFNCLFDFRYFSVKYAWVMLEYPPNVLWRWKQCKHIWVCRVLPHLTDCVIWALCPIHYSDSITHHLSGGLSDASPLAKMRDLPSVVSNKSCGMLLEIANLNQCNKRQKTTLFVVKCLV